MIVYEEKAMERILTLGFCDTAIPVSVREYSGDDAEICALPSLKRVAVEFEKKFSGDYFSKDAHEWLRERIRPFMHSIGYHDNRQSRRITNIYSLDADTHLPDTGDAERLFEVKKNLTTTDIHSLLEFGHIVCVIIKDGAIVCTAYTDLPPEGDEVEIGVETAPLYRQRGYAKAALSLLINELKAIGISPIYACSQSNRASVRLAKSLGFTLEAREYDYIFRRD